MADSSFNSPVGSYAPDPVDEDLGGNYEGGLWLWKEGSHSWTNTFYEDYPVNEATAPYTKPIKDWLPTDPSSIDRHDGFFKGTWAGPTPQVILTSLKQFLVERSRAYDRRDQEIRMREMEEDRKNAITYDEYLKMKEEGLLPECS